MHRARYVGKGMEFPCLLRACHFTSLEGLQNPSFRVFMEALLHRPNWSNHWPLVINLIYCLFLLGGYQLHPSRYGWKGLIMYNKRHFSHPFQEIPVIIELCARNHGWPHIPYILIYNNYCITISQCLIYVFVTSLHITWYILEMIKIGWMNQFGK